METKNILLIGGLILILFLFLRNVNGGVSTPVYTPMPTSTTVIYRKPATTTSTVYVNPPHYNAYKAQYYN